MCLNNSRNDIIFICALVVSTILTGALNVEPSDNAFYEGLKSNDDAYSEVQYTKANEIYALCMWQT